jgi:hypothetical protein
VQGGQRLGAQERRRKKLVLGRDLDPLARQVEDDAAVDDEFGHVAVDATALRSAAARAAHCRSAGRSRPATRAHPPGVMLHETAIERGR